MPSSYFLIGGAGFIGSHFVDRLLWQTDTIRVTVYDNFASGREAHLAAHRDDARLSVVTNDVKDLDVLCGAMVGHETVIHLASNPDIARAVNEPDIDFREGTALTSNVLEAMRRTGSRYLLYASGSGVYGEHGRQELSEDHLPLRPISTYGASKLAGEAMIFAYSAMFGLHASMFRFGNVVGPRQTHGVGFDFVRALRRNPGRLRILGDGSQSKSYIHVEDVVAAVLLAAERQAVDCDVYNVATDDYASVQEIAELAVEAMGLAAGSVIYDFTGGDRGWRGDVPIIRLSSKKIKALGWSGAQPTRQALRRALAALAKETNA